MAKCKSAAASLISRDSYRPTTQNEGDTAKRTCADADSGTKTGGVALGLGLCGRGVFWDWDPGLAVSLGGVVDIRGRRDFSRFDPSPGEAPL